MMHWFPFVVLGLAIFRVVKLLIDDLILDPLREKTVWKLDPQSKLREFLECPWCLSFWLSVVAVGLYLLWPVVITWLALPFAFSAIVGVLAAVVSKLTD